MNRDAYDGLGLRLLGLARAVLSNLALWAVPDTRVKFMLLLLTDWLGFTHSTHSGLCEEFINLTQLDSVRNRRCGCDH